MNRPIYDKNMVALEKKYPVWAEIVRTHNWKKKTTFSQSAALKR